ncbi:hypothetical protein NE237_015894 [Protea cynaroides]|uniref:Integrase catalytic domain-containing protein n=1 Tax=Protea cynaroides TaxID=273540 RepID=A0A9Q0QRI7_9MAGN|nr:hypothetical protein NE237_015894 [Protea cynaroides]
MTIMSKRGLLCGDHCLWGPAQVPSKGGALYFLTFSDDYFRKVLVHFLKRKSDVFKNFKKCKVLVENQTGRKIKLFRIDNGLEFCSGEFNKFCTDSGIALRVVRYTPQKNGVTEHMNMILMERARSKFLMLYSGNSNLIPMSIASSPVFFD